MSALFASARSDGVQSTAAWALQTQLVQFLETGWAEPDDGIWEVRGPRRHFTHSKVMAWVAVDRAVKTLEEWPELEGPLEEWRVLRHKIFTEVCEKGYNEKIGSFTQYYNCDQLDASVLMIPLVGFLPPTDPRVISTVEAVEKALVDDGFVLRYRTTDDGSVDGLTGREGAFLACSFWLVDCLHMIGRKDDAEELFTRLLALRNDLGLLSEEYDAVDGRLVGNFPQAFSHVSLVNSACNLAGHHLEDVVPSPEAVQAVRRAIFRRHQGMARGRDFWVPPAQFAHRGKDGQRSTPDEAGTRSSLRSAARRARRIGKRANGDEAPADGDGGEQGSPAPVVTGSDPSLSSDHSSNTT
jgi:Glycosyl hydrolases family 15